MRVCLMIEGQEGVTWDEWRAIARACEEAGLDGLFRSDHYASPSEYPLDSLDAWATLAALAAETERTSRAAGSSSGSARAGWSSSTAP